MTTPLVVANNVKTEKRAQTPDTDGSENEECVEIGVEESGNAVTLFCYNPGKEKTIKPKDTKDKKTKNIEEVPVKKEDELMYTELNIKSESDDDDTIYECENCSYSTWNPYALKGHFKRRHAKEKAKPNSICDQCGFGASCRKVLVEHKIRKHSTEMPGVTYHTCDCCDYKTTKAWQLAIHKQTHSKQIVTCTICQKPFKICRIYNHCRTVHKIHSIGSQLIGPFKCAHCDFEVMSKVALRNHITAEHPRDGQNQGQKENSVFSVKTEEESEVQEVEVEDMLIR